MRCFAFFHDIYINCLKYDNMFFERFTGKGFSMNMTEQRLSKKVVRCPSKACSGRYKSQSDGVSQE